MPDFPAKYAFSLEKTRPGNVFFAYLRLFYRLAPYPVVLAVFLDFSGSI
jgi:hypothetical protein